MKKETYDNMQDTINSHDILRGIVLFSDWFFTKVVYVSYILLIALIIIKKEPGLVPALVVPAVSFVLLSAFRYIVNAPRPYEVFDGPSVIKRSGRGKSFPSRHVFSVFIIATTVCYFNSTYGLILFAIGLIIAATRVIGGVHFPRDVIAGALIGIGLGCIGLYLVVPHYLPQFI